ncbi:hypothetical protein BSKO_00157 [Bryopsis sp. KO-2023]|nr:hypothetical protein BSKO_00157 [Bryopsis sp. KO-2023]
MEDLIFHTHLFIFPLKSAQGGTTPIDFQQQASNLGISTKQTEPFFKALSETRSALLGFLENADTTQDSVNSALTSYLSKLNHLLIPSANADVEAGTSPDASDLNHVFRFEWRSGLGNESGAVASSDVRYEIVSILLSVALWKARKAAESCTKAAGVRPTATEISQAYKWYQEAAGLISHTLKVIPHLQDCPSLDCNRSILEGLLKALLAEAEGLTVLRAATKRSSTSLIASLALDVHQLYESASSMQTPGETCHKKFIAYLHYKSECFKAYALIFHANARLEEMAGGDAMRLAQESKTVFEGACTLGNAYDSFSPATSFGLRSEFQSDLERTITESTAKAEKDNHGVYLQQMPELLPEMPESKRLVKQEEFVFPPPDSTISRDGFAKVDWKTSTEGKVTPGYEIVKGTEAGAGKTEEGGDASSSPKPAAWWRWLIVFLTIPLLAVVTLLGVIVWIVLLPVKFICCPIGCAAQMLWNVVEWLIKAPLRVAMWASGKPWKPESVPQAPPAS